MVFMITTPFITPNDQWEMLVPILICIASAGLVLWILLDTKYEIRGSFLKYSSGPVRGKIDIFRITKIENQEGFWTGTTLKPALGIAGLIIRYSKFDDIYISPKNKKEFIEALLEINPHIEIK